MTPEERSKEVSKLLADNYSQKILAYTYSSPMSAQKLSKLCRIPIAACYRRIHELEEAGLITIDQEKEVYKGRRVRMYKCRLKSAALKFSKGRFSVKFDVHPEDDDSIEPDPGNRVTRLGPQST